MANLKLNRLADELMDCANNGTMTARGIKLTIADFNDLWDGGREILYKGFTETISETSMKVFKKFKFNVEPSGTGWRITR